MLLWFPVWMMSSGLEAVEISEVKARLRDLNVLNLVGQNNLHSRILKALTYTIPGIVSNCSLKHITGD